MEVEHFSFIALVLDLGKWLALQFDGCNPGNVPQISSEYDG